MKILVTGSNGFLGTCLVDLLKRSHQVLTTDCVGCADYVGDLSNEEFTRKLPDCDAVVHCAAVQYVTRNVPIFRRKAFFQRNNVVVAKNLYERYKAVNLHFVNIGTSMMYRQDESVIYSENSAMDGDGVYSESKYDSCNALSRLKCYSEIIPCIIGGEGRGGLFEGFVNTIRKWRIAIVPGSGAHPTSMVHVSDVASLILKVVELKALGTFNAAADSPLSINAWVEIVAKVCRVNRVCKINIPYFVVAFIASITMYRLLAREQLIMLGQPHILLNQKSRDLGWVPKFTNEDIVKHTAIGIVKKEW